MNEVKSEISIGAARSFPDFATLIRATGFRFTLPLQGEGRPPNGSGAKWPARWQAPAVGVGCAAVPLD
jgi:hypothetical protein